jgi:hypothetical protein
MLLASGMMTVHHTAHVGHHHSILGDVMYYNSNSHTKKNTYTYYKKFSFERAEIPFIALDAGYPTYLGVNIFEAEEKYLGKNLLGFTNGNFIVVKKGMGKALRLFVQFHEEEHVKDMFATEKEVDKRALKRLMSRNVKKEELREVRHLLKQRWGNSF